MKIVKLMVRISPRLWMERELRYRPNHFEPEFWIVPFLCDKGKTSLDIGANSGYYSYFLRKFSKEVIAFEPNTELWPDLRRLLGKDFHLERAALSNKMGTATLRVDPTNTGISTIEQSNKLVCVADESIVRDKVVEIRTLDSFGFSDIGMIKIDVEGHEEAVISGGVKTIERNRPSLLVESENRHNPGAPNRLAETISRLEYQVYFLKDDKLMEFSALRDEDVDAGNLVKRQRPYINNFIFIPAERQDRVGHIRAFLERRKRSRDSLLSA